MKKKLAPITQKTVFALICLGILAIILSGCGLLNPPTVYAGQYYNMQKDSKPIVQVGTNGSQANAVHAAIGDAVAAAEGEKAEADKTTNTAKSSGLFVNNAVGDRSADVDAAAALELLKDVQGTSAGQTMTASKGDQSPATGSQTQTPSNTQTETKTNNIPVSVSQRGASAAATTNAAEKQGETEQ